MLAEGCRREGLFDAMGGLMAAGARGSPRRLLALVFAVAAAVTAVLSLDATVVLLTPIVFATAARLRTSPRPHVYACSHLANSASLLLPVSNLTNLLAFHASGLSFMRFAGLMALPTAAAVAVEWVVLTRFFAVDLRPAAARRARTTASGRRCRASPLAVVALTLAGFAAELGARDRARVGRPPRARRRSPRRRSRGARRRRGRSPWRPSPRSSSSSSASASIVRAASDNGLGDAAARRCCPRGVALPELLAVAAVSAILANLVNNLPGDADPRAGGGAVGGRGGARGARSASTSART